MELPAQSSPYHELVAAADQILDECDDDVALLSEKLDQLPDQVRDELLVSDMLNAFQVFYYFLRKHPVNCKQNVSFCRRDRPFLMAYSLTIELFDLIFAIIDHQPVIVVSDGEHALGTFLGPDAYRDGLMYIESTL